MDEVQKDIEKYQSNLMKNLNSSLLDNNEKNKLLKVFMDLQDVEKSIYRYNVLKNNNHLAAAEEEKAEIEHKVLKGHICNVKYVWRSEHGEHTCEECESMDGEEFESDEDIPPKPHPNCKCYIEVYECPYEPEYSPDDDDNNNEENPQPKKPQEEPCDTIYEIENLISEMEGTLQKTEGVSADIENDISNLENDVTRVENLIQDTDLYLEKMSGEYGKHLPDCENNIDSDYENISAKRTYLQELLQDVWDILEKSYIMINTVRIFVSNYMELLYHAYVLKEYEMDKYYHSKANCETVQQMGELGEEAAKELSDFKEEFDQWNNVYAKSHKVSVEEAIADSERDQVANRLGRERGRNNPNCPCSELMKDLLPNKNKK